MADPQNLGVSHWRRGIGSADVGMKLEAPYLAACHAIRHAMQFNGMSSDVILLNSKNIHVMYR